MVYFLFGILSLVSIPLLPYMMESRIRFLRRIGWTWGAAVNEYTFEGRLLSGRFCLLLMAGMCFYMGWDRLSV